MRRAARSRSSTSSTPIRTRRSRTRNRSRRSSQWPQAGAADLDRIKQALWDAFNGTGSRVTESRRRSRRSRRPQVLPDRTSTRPASRRSHRATIRLRRHAENVVADQRGAAGGATTSSCGDRRLRPGGRARALVPADRRPGISTGFQSGNLFADFAPEAVLRAVKARSPPRRGPARAVSTASARVGAHDRRDRRAGDLRWPGHGPARSPTSRPLRARGLGRA